MVEAQKVGFEVFFQKKPRFCFESLEVFGGFFAGFPLTFSIFS